MTNVPAAVIAVRADALAAHFLEISTLLPSPLVPADPRRVAPLDGRWLSDRGIATSTFLA